MKGLTLDYGLKWDIHINSLTDKLQQINYKLFYLRHYLNRKDLIYLYKCWYEAALRYGIIHWGGTFPTLLNNLRVCQKMTLRTICGARKYDSTVPLFKELQIMRVDELYKYNTLCFVKRFISIYQPKVTSVRTRSTAHMKLELPRFFKTTNRNQCCYSAPAVANEFATKIDFSQPYKKFTSILKEILRNN